MLLALAVWVPRVSADPYPADNTGKNVRDRSGDTLTTGDQSERTQDVTLTQAVRKALVADDSLSTNAHNVKVITVDGIVTLRGPVNSSQEKAKVAATAERIADERVDNQLEVAPITGRTRIADGRCRRVTWQQTRYLASHRTRRGQRASRRSSPTASRPMTFQCCSRTRRGRDFAQEACQAAEAQRPAA
jgi:hypothetical protein